MNCYAAMALQVHDRMTEQVYAEPLSSFASPVTPSPVFTVPVLEQGRRALEEINEELGLAFDEQARHISPLHLITCHGPGTYCAFSCTFACK